MQLEQKQMMMATFEYEIREGNLGLYDRADCDKGRDMLRPLAKVPFENSIEDSVRNAVSKIYEVMNIPSQLRIQAKDIHSKKETIDYILSSP